MERVTLFGASLKTCAVIDKVLQAQVDKLAPNRGSSQVENRVLRASLSNLRQTGKRYE